MNIIKIIKDYFTDAKNVKKLSQKYPIGCKLEIKDKFVCKIDVETPFSENFVFSRGIDCHIVSTFDSEGFTTVLLKVTEFFSLSSRVSFKDLDNYFQKVDKIFAHCLPNADYIIQQEACNTCDCEHPSNCSKGYKYWHEHKKDDNK